MIDVYETHLVSDTLWRGYQLVMTRYQVMIALTWENLWQRAQRQGFVFAAKCVRGAYMVQESCLALAKERGYV